MKPKIWPKLDLERLSSSELDAVQTVCRFIIETQINPPLPGNRRNFRLEFPREKVLMDHVVKRELDDKMSGDAREILGQFGMNEVEINQAIGNE